MPIYEYRCDECGRTAEKIQRAGVEGIACPHCGGAARRVVSACAGQTGNAAGGEGGCPPKGGFR